MLVLISCLAREQKPCLQDRSQVVEGSSMIVPGMRCVRVTTLRPCPHKRRRPVTPSDSRDTDVVREVVLERLA
eukprot:2693296-Prorocentrum_lima.AAC.1